MDKDQSKGEAVSIEEVEVPSSGKDEPKKSGRPVKDIEEGRRISVSIAMSPKVLGRITEKADQLDISRSDLVNKMLVANMDGITFENEQEFEAVLDRWIDKKHKEAEEERKDPGRGSGQRKERSTGTRPRRKTRSSKRRKMKGSSVTCLASNKGDLD